jgi:Cu2+-exporting ATPase
VPVAARLLVHDADFNLAWISGESAPRHLPAGRLVPAGAINAGQDDIVLEARENWSDSLLARLLRACRESAPRATGFERPMQFYFAAVFALATLGGIYWLTVGQPITAARAVLSLLVVSCPCVIGLSLPMAHELAVASLRRSGVFVRETHLWSRLARVRTLVFDKTGTLTFEHPVLQNPDALSRLLPATRQLLFHLVENSLHPFSRALREALLQFPDAVLPLPNAPQPTEVSGAGLWIRVNDATWSLGRAGWIVGVETSTQSATGGEPRAEVELRREGLVVAALHITERARPGTAEELAALARDGFAIHILSGDQPTKVSAFARSIGLAPERAHGGLTPEAKAAWVDAHHPENILILGDGANDALAFGRAAVRGTPVADRTVLGSAADFFLTSQNLSGVRELFAVARRRRRAARTAGTFALTYNIAAASVSLAGIMNPLLAAVLMPLSAVISLALVGAAFRAPTKSSSSLKAA